VKGKVVPVL